MASMTQTQEFVQRTRRKDWYRQSHSPGCTQSVAQLFQDRILS